MKKTIESFHTIISIDYVKPICLPYEDNMDEEYQLNNLGNRLKTWVACWGATDPDSELHSVSMNVMDQCQYERTIRYSLVVITFDHNIMFLSGKLLLSFIFM